MIDDVLTTIKAQLYERATSPLLGSFLISWCIVNYQFLMIVLSGITVTEKISYIDAYIFPTTKQLLLSGLILPSLGALSIIFIYPIPAKYIFKHARNNHKAMKEIQQIIDDETPLTLEESKKIRKTAISESIDLSAEIERRKKDNADLKESILGYKEIIANHNAEINEIKRKNGELEEATRLAKRELVDEMRSAEDLRAILNTISRHPKLTKYGKIVFSNPSVSDEPIATSGSPLLNSYNRVLLNANLKAKTEIENFIEKQKTFKDNEFQVIAGDGKLIILIDDDVTEWGNFSHENLSVDLEHIKQKLEAYARTDSSE